MTQPSQDDRGGWTSASNAEADELCPGRHLAQKGMPDIKGEYADTGNKLHHALATGDSTGLTLNLLDTYDACQKIVEKKLVDFFGPARPRIWREHRFWINAQYRHSGQVDRVDRQGAKALVFEFKSLPGDVPSSPRNMQLRDQAVLVWKNLLVEQVGTVVVQPMVTHSPEICLYEELELNMAFLQMAARVAKSNDPKSPRIAGEIQCKWCKAKTDCREYRKWATEGMAMVPASLVDTMVDKWDGAQCALFLSRKAEAQKWLDDVYLALKARLKADGASIPGYGLKDGAERETVNNPQQLFERFNAVNGTLEGFMKSIAVVKKSFRIALHEATGLKGMALDKKLEELYDGITTKKISDASIERLPDE